MLIYRLNAILRIKFKIILLIPLLLVSNISAVPLKVSSENHRYFTDGKKEVYLTGSHTWENFQERIYSDSSFFDYTTFLDFLKENNHNFLRLWVWESSIRRLKDQKVVYAPLPFERTGPGFALDGKPKFDLSKFNQTYFDRLRKRLEDANRRGLYVSIMLFQGFSVSQKNTIGAIDSSIGNPWEGHPFHKNNNINQIDGDLNGDNRGLEIHTMSNALQTVMIRSYQEAYIKKVIDTVNDLDNVLYEICNECHNGSTSWQYHMINLIKDYEKTKPKQHPVGMTFQWDKQYKGTNQNLYNSPAEWISPAQEFGQCYKNDPPLSDGTKIIITDTDHLWGVGGSVSWIWKSFTRGLNPIFMDPYKHGTKGILYDSQWDPERKAMGQTLQYAERMNLAVSIPSKTICSTTYCLVNPGNEYLVFQPDSGPFTLRIEAGEYEFEWFDPISGTVMKKGILTTSIHNRPFLAPFSGEAVLFLKRIQFITSPSNSSNNDNF